MEFLYGMVGAIGVLFVFFGGAFAGYKVRERVYKAERTVTAEQVSEAERARLVAEQIAFNQMQNYNVETAYGMAQEELPKEE